MLSLGHQIRREGGQSPQEKTLRRDSLWMRGNEERGNVSLVTSGLPPEMIFILPQLQIFTSTIST